MKRVMAGRARDFLAALAIGVCMLIPAAAMAGTGDGGATAATFLRLGNSGAAAAQGEAFVATSGVIDALHYNPGGLTRIGKAQVQMQHNEYLLDIKSDYLAGAVSVGKWTLGSSLLVLNQGKFTRRTISNPGGAGQFSAGAQMLSMAVSREFGGWLSAGAASRFFQEKLDTAKRGGMAIDLGLHVVAVEDLLEAGFAVRNIGPAVKFDRDEEPLPLEISMGLNVPRLFIRGLKVSTALSFVRRQEPEFSVGIEYGIMNVVFLRAGFNSRNDLGPGLSAGLGFRVSKLTADYAFVPFSDAGNSHRLSMTLAFGSAPPAVPRRPASYSSERHNPARRRETEILSALAPIPAEGSGSVVERPPEAAVVREQVARPAEPSPKPSMDDPSSVHAPREDTQWMRYLSEAWESLALNNVDTARVYASRASAASYDDVEPLLAEIERARNSEAVENTTVGIEAMLHVSKAWEQLAAGNLALAESFANKAIARGSDGSIPIIRRVYVQKSNPRRR